MPPRGGAPRTWRRRAALPRCPPLASRSRTPRSRWPGISAPAGEPIHLSFHSPPRAGLLFNLTTGQVLWQRNPYLRVPMASLTKMMTALLTVKSAPPTAPVLVTRQAVATDGSKVGVLPLGREVRLESMLYGLMLPSGNDAAVALAQHVAGSVSAFVRRMNTEAASLGMGCTRYSSPSGYYDAGNFTCAADLAVLAHADLEQPRIASVTRTYSAVLPFPIKGGKLYLYNNNPLLIYHYPGITGLKTGYTEAGGPLPGGHRRAPRRAPGGRDPQLRRPGHPGAPAARPRLLRRLPPAPHTRSAAAAGHLARASNALRAPGTRLERPPRPRGGGGCASTTRMPVVEYRSPERD